MATATGCPIRHALWSYKWDRYSHTVVWWGKFVFKWTLRFGEYTDLSRAVESDIFIVLGLEKTLKRSTHSSKYRNELTPTELPWVFFCLKFLSDIWGEFRFLLIVGGGGRFSCWIWFQMEIEWNSLIPLSPCGSGSLVPGTAWEGLPLAGNRWGELLVYQHLSTHLRVEGEKLSSFSEPNPHKGIKILEKKVY